MPPPPGRRRTGGVSTNPQSTQRQAGADDKMNPTITTGTASNMGVSGPEPSPPGLYRAAYMEAGKRPYPQDTAESGADEEMNPTITTGTAFYMGVSGPEPSPQGLYRAAYIGAGKRRYPQDTAEQRR